MLTPTQIELLKSLNIDPDLPEEELKAVIEFKISWLEENLPAPVIEDDLNKEILPDNSPLTRGGGQHLEGFADLADNTDTTAFNQPNYTGRKIVAADEKNSQDFVLWKFIDEKSLQKWRFGDFEEAKEILEVYRSDHIMEIFDQYAEELENKYGQWVAPETYEKYESPIIRISNLFIEELKNKYGCPGWHSECVAMICSILGEKKYKSKQFSFSYFAKKNDQSGLLEQLKSVFTVKNLEEKILAL